MTLAGKWGYSHDGELFFGGFDTKQEACREAEARELGSYFVGQFRAPILEQAFNADDIIEKIVSQDDYCGEWAERALECSQKQLDELTIDLRRVFLLWIGKHGLEPTFGIVSNSEEIHTSQFQNCERQDPLAPSI